MTKLTKAFAIETAFDTYTLDTIIGEGGAGRVYGGVDGAGTPVAVKVLTQTSADKRRRFKNEIGFLSRNQHPNIVTVIDHGAVTAGPVKGPFYVMPLYRGSLRRMMLAPRDGERFLRWFGQILDGVEAAHLRGVVHRDIKPENVLIGPTDDILLVADFGVARFTEEELHTAVRTGDGQRLANFQYAAPEQRTPGASVSVTTDIYALGLLLNELFTGKVPHGTNYETIEGANPEFAFLDPIVAAMIRQNPSDRPATIAAVKQDILRYRDDAVTLQRLSQINNTVIKMGDVDDPLAHDPPQLIGASWANGVLTLTLDRPVNQNWLRGLNNMGGHSAVWGRGPETFSFNGKVATVQAEANQAQPIVDHFKVWLPNASRAMKQMLETAAKREEYDRQQALARAREAEEQRLRINKSLRI